MPDRATVPGSADILVKPEKNNYRERHGVVVLCKDTAHQETVYKQLRAMKLRCRVVSV